MIFMALLPKPEEAASHHPKGYGYPSAVELWQTIETALKARLSTEQAILAGGRYRLSWVMPDALGIVRTETGSTVRVTRKKVEKTYLRLLAGEEIPHRAIDYTVAIEFGVLVALGDLVESDEAAKVYRLAKRS